MPNENENRPADVAQADSVGGMARRLANPAHLADLARRSAATLREQGAEQLWRDVTFRVGLAFHHDSWRHRADIPLRRQLKAQRAAPLRGRAKGSSAAPAARHSACSPAMYSASIGRGMPGPGLKVCSAR